MQIINWCINLFHTSLNLFFKLCVVVRCVISFYNLGFVWRHTLSSTINKKLLTMEFFDWYQRRFNHCLLLNIKYALKLFLQYASFLHFVIAALKTDVIDCHFMLSQNFSMHRWLVISLKDFRNYCIIFLPTRRFNFWSWFENTAFTFSHLYLRNMGIFGRTFWWK